jgi:hypothetical protein
VATLTEQGQQQIALQLVLTHVKNMLNDSSDGRPFHRRGTHDNEASAGDEGSGTTNKLELLEIIMPWICLYAMEVSW